MYVSRQPVKCAADLRVEVDLIEEIKENKAADGELESIRGKQFHRLREKDRACEALLVGQTMRDIYYERRYDRSRAKRAI